MQSSVPPELRGFFTTGVAGITTQGKEGPNLMSAEWTFNVSYHPFLIAVLIDPSEATHDIIAETKEFGVNIWDQEQAQLSSAAGKHSMREVDKLPNPIFRTYKATRIKAPMIESCVLNAECRLFARYSIGDHTMYVGEVLLAKYNQDKKPLLLRGGSGYHQLGPRIRTGEKPFIYIFAGLRKSEHGHLLNMQGRIFGSEEDQEVLISAQDGKGKMNFSENIPIRDGGFFSSSVRFDNGAPRGPCTITATYRELKAECEVLLR